MGKLLVGAKTYIKQNWFFLLIMIVGAAALLAQMSQVVLYADDYSLSVYADGNPETLFKYFTAHYTTWGGGYTGVLVILALSGAPIVWQLFFTLLLALFVGLTVKITCKNHPKQKWLVATVLWSCLFLLSIWISRETIYWLDGGMAYLFSTLQAFLVFYFFYTRLIQKISHKYDAALIPLVAFFGGWSSAQSGVMAVVTVIAFIIWQRCIKKEKIKPLFYISAILALIGFLIFYFAPGNSARMGEFEVYASLNLFEKVAYRIGSVLALILGNSEVEFSAAPIFVYLAIGLTAIVDLKSISAEKSKKLKIFRLCCSIYSLLFIFAFLLGTFNIPGLSSICRYAFKYVNLLNVFHGEHGAIGYLAIFPYLAAILTIFANLSLAFLIGKRKNDPFLFTVLLIGYIAELCMVMAPYSPLRTTLYTITFMWLAIGYLVLAARTDNASIFPVALLIFTIFSFQLGLALLFAYIILTFLWPNFTNRKLPASSEIYLFLSVLVLLAGFNYSKILINYHRNKTINEQNITILIDAASAYAETGELPEVLYLKKPYNELYGFTGLAGIVWVEQAVTEHFNLPTTLDLEYEGVNQ